MVRATRRTRWKPRAERRIDAAASASSFRPASSGVAARSSTSPSASAFVRTPEPLYLSAWTWRALGNNLSVVVLSIVIQLPVAVLLAVMLERHRTFVGKVLKTIYFFPMLMSSVAVGILFKYIYDPNFGLINETLRRAGLGALAQSWLGDPRFALPAVVLVICWQFIPFYMILFYAALSNVPGELKDAARIDGADEGRYYRHIAVPLIMGTVRTAVILSLIGSLKYFDLVWVMTEGGPNNASELMATYMYKKAFPSFEVGCGSTVAFAMFAFVLLVSVVAQTLSRRLDYRRAA